MLDNRKKIYYKGGIIMGFTTPCFIRKNTPELRNKLNKLGYFPHPTANPLYNNRNGDLHTGRGFYANLPIGYIEETNNAIDCGANEELFLAIAALRDDTDRGQFFVTEARLGSINCPDSIIEKGSFIICCTDKWDSVDIPSHKASVLELIEHFKKQ